MAEEPDHARPLRKEGPRRNIWSPVLVLMTLAVLSLALVFVLVRLDVINANVETQVAGLKISLGGGSALFMAIYLTLLRSYGIISRLITAVAVIALIPASFLAGYGVLSRDRNQLIAENPSPIAQAPLYSQSPELAFGLDLLSRKPGVGGVSLGHKLIEMQVDLSSSLMISYDVAEPDGTRVRLSKNKRVWTVPAWDWQVIPVAKLVDRGDLDIVSLFGDGPDPKSFYYVQINPAFKDTLLGLRLLQADLLPIWIWKGSQLRDLPQSEVIGPGEPQFNPDASEAAIKELRRILLQSPIDNWIVTDFDTRPRLDFGQVLSIQTSPYYLFCESIEWKEPGVISKSQGDGFCIPAWDIIDEFRTNPTVLYAASPAIFDSVKQAAFLSELFYKLRHTNPVAWKMFFQTVVKEGHIDSVPLPDRIPR